jgi:hypothetical protein
MARYETGDYPRCGETYGRLLAEYPEHPKRDELRANAIACFEAAGERERVRALREGADRERRRSSHRGSASVWPASSSGSQR